MGPCYWVFFTALHLFRAVLAMNNMSVRLSVCPSVRPFHRICNVLYHHYVLSRVLLAL